MKSISILGATGSIGTQTLDVIRNSEGTINLIGITANSSVDKIKEIIKEFKPKYVVSGNRVYQRGSGRVWHREKADHKDNAFSRGSIGEIKGACQRP